MRAVAESIKRLYQSGKIDKPILRARVEKGTITTEEYAEICGESYD